MSQPTGYNPVIVKSQSYAWSKHMQCIEELDNNYRRWIQRAMEQKLVVHKKLQSYMYNSLTEIKETDPIKWNMMMNKHLQVIHDLEHGYASDIAKLLQQKLHIHMNMMKHWYQYVFQQLIKQYEEKTRQIYQPNNEGH